MNLRGNRNDSLRGDPERIALKSQHEPSQHNDDVQQKWRRPELLSGRPREELGVSGGRHGAAEGGVDVPEVVLQRRHLLRVLLRGEDLGGKLSQLTDKRTVYFSSE